MKNLKNIFVLFIFVIVSEAALAQDPTFTQFYANPLYLNPAFAGSNNCPRFALNYRNEWPNLSGNYTTYSASYDQHIKNISGGIGVLVTHDEQGQGTIKTNMLGLIYSYHLKITRKFSIRFGAQASYYQKSLDSYIYMYSFNINPIHNNNYSGCNFSRISNSQLQIIAQTNNFYINNICM